MHGLLFATALVVLIAAGWRLVRALRALRRRRAAARPGSIPRTHLPSPALAPRVALRSKPPRRAEGARGGVLVLEGLPLDRLEIDELPYPLTGATTVAARGLYGVPCGRHRVRLRGVGGAGDARSRSLDVVMPAGGSLRVSLGAEGDLEVHRAPRGELDAAYIHYPTWARGPLLDRRARPIPDVAGLGAEIARAFVSTERDASARLADRLVGVALTQAELDALRNLCRDQVARATAAEREEARARARVLLPEVEAAER